MKTLETYDNNGKTFDRYLAIINGHIYTMSDNPMSPQGVCLYHGIEINRELIEKHNVRVELKELPEEVQKKIKEIQDRR